MVLGGRSVTVEFDYSERYKAVTIVTSLLASRLPSGVHLGFALAYSPCVRWGHDIERRTHQKGRTKQNRGANHVGRGVNGACF